MDVSCFPSTYFEALQRGLKSFEKFSFAFIDHIFLILEAKLLEFTSQQVHHIFFSIQEHSIALQE